MEVTFPGRLVLADAGPLYAAVDPSDQYHVQARDELDSLDAEGRGIAVSWSTAIEAYSLVLRQFGTRVAHDWLDDVMQGTLLIPPTMADYQLGAHVARRYPDQHLTLFDAVLYALSERLEVPIWTYDFHFDVMRARRWYRG